MTETVGLYNFISENDYVSQFFKYTAQVRQKDGDLVDVSLAIPHSAVYEHPVLAYDGHRLFNPELGPIVIRMVEAGMAYRRKKGQKPSTKPFSMVLEWSPLWDEIADR